MNKEELKKRIKDFAVRVFKFSNMFPNGKDVDLMSYQSFKASFLVAANYRAACRSKSYNNFSNKLKTVNEEANERLFWLEFIKEPEWNCNRNELNYLKNDANELVSIFSSTIKTISEKQNRSKKSLIINR